MTQREIGVVQAWLDSLEPVALGLATEQAQSSAELRAFEAMATGQELDSTELLGLLVLSYLQQQLDGRP